MKAALLDAVRAYGLACQDGHYQERADLYADIEDRVDQLAPDGVPARWLLGAAVAGFTVGSVLARRGAR